jgi:hypothetical protein
MPFAGVSSWVNSWMSAPAMKPAAFPERKISPLAAGAVETVEQHCEFVHHRAGK